MRLVISEKKATNQNGITSTLRTVIENGQDISALK